MSRIDPTVAILDGIGLLLFIIPGLVAFAVDFHTGAIYLPETSANAGSRVIHVDPKGITPETLVETIYAETGVRVSLAEAQVHLMQGVKDPAAHGDLRAQVTQQ